jgi:phage-related protein
MAKPPMMVHVQSSEFRKLLEVQQLSLEHVQSIKTLIESGAPAKQTEELLKVQKEQLEEQEKLVKISKVSAEELKRIKAEETEALTNLAQTVKTFDSIKDRFANAMKGITTKFGSMRAAATTTLKAINVGGFFDKKIAEREFVDQQRKLGSDKSDKELRQDFAQRNKVSKDIKANEAEIEKFRKDTGLSEKQLSGTKEGQRLLSKRESLSDAFAKTDLRATLVARPEAAGTTLTNKEQNDSVNVSEEEQESIRREEEQNALLVKIEKNTSSLGGDKTRAAAPSSPAGGGLLGGIGAGLTALGTGLNAIGKGAGGAVAGILTGIANGVIALSKALGALGKGIGQGIAGIIQGIAMGVSAFANPKVAIGLGVAVLALMGLGKALQFAAPFMEAFAPVLIKVADVVQNVFVSAIEQIPNVITAVGDVVMGVIKTIADSIIGTIDAITNSIERLSKLDGANMIQVGLGLAAISGGMLTFAAANVAQGLSNLVSGFLSFMGGQKNPVDQILALGNAGPNIEKAGVGVEKLGTGLKLFSDIKPENIKAIAALPVEKIAAMGAAMGQANFVSNQSAANDGARTSIMGTAGGGGSTVVAPVTNNKTTNNQVVQLPVRNQEQTMNRYIKTRFAT